MDKKLVFPLSWWGHDHWSTLAYVEARCVDHDGYIGNENMRTCPRHPQFAGRFVPSKQKAMRGTPGDSRVTTEYPTRIVGGLSIAPHDDWDCLRDMEDAGMLRIRSPRNREWWEVEPGRARGPLSVGDGIPTEPVTVRVSLTPLGRAVAGQLRAHLQIDRKFRTFVPDFEKARAAA